VAPVGIAFESQQTKGAPVVGIRPRPVASDLTMPYWQAALEGRLAIQRCNDCGWYHHPPVPVCLRCRRGDLTWQDVSGHGVIAERVVVRQALVTGFESSVPFCGVAVELVEQPGLLVIANLVGPDALDGRVGDPVEMEIDVIDAELALPQFRLRRDAERNLRNGR
jgi:uncharacterized OB-fold protein